MSDKEVAGAAVKVASNTRYDATPEQARTFVAGLEILTGRLRQVCDRDGPDHEACRRCEHLEEELREFFEAIVSRASPEDLVTILADHPRHARKYNCLMTRALFSSVLMGETCQRRTAVLKRFYQKGPLECSLTSTMNRLVDNRCPQGLEVIVSDVMPEDLETSSREFNSGNKFKPRLLDEHSDKRYGAGIALGKILARANRAHCKKDGPSSPNCKAARRVESEMARLEAENQRIRSPETILAELCRVDRELKSKLARLDRVKREGELSGAPNRSELASLAGMIVSAEGLYKSFSARFKKAAKKPFSDGMCK